MGALVLAGLITIGVLVIAAVMEPWKMLGVAGLTAAFVGLSYLIGWTLGVKR